MGHGRASCAGSFTLRFKEDGRNGWQMRIGAEDEDGGMEGFENCWLNVH